MIAPAIVAVEGSIPMRIAALVVAAVVLATTPALAQTDPQEPPVPVQTGTTVVGEQPEAGERPDPDAEVICRVVEEVGSRLARRRQRICGTRTMWEQVEDQNARDLRRHGAVNTAPRN
jgi:hypothetical protein